MEENNNYVDAQNYYIFSDEEISQKEEIKE
jgi:hypothetical protein